MHALWLLIAAACIFVIAYRLYGAFIAAKVLALNDSNPTPAMAHPDGKDYVPTNKYVLFGHHFAAIAGAGPLIGPILAAQFGFLPGYLWILIGAVIGGAVHDFVILVGSIRKNGKSLYHIAKEEVGPVTGFAVGIAVLFIVVIAMAGLGIALINALKNSPWATFTIACTIPIALLVGLYMYRLRPGRVGEASILGVLLLILAVAGGAWVQASASLAPFFTFDAKTLVIMLAAYGFLASILPVWLLLAPRDYLSSYMKIGTVLVLAVGVILLNPVIQMPAVTQFVHGGGPIIPGTVFPFVFITIACGAISGFHALISSGTTPKMIMKESEALFIGFGGMLMEGFVAIMAIIAATVLVPGDYFAINVPVSRWVSETMPVAGMAMSQLPQLTALVGESELAGRTGGAVSLAVGMAFIFQGLPLVGKLMGFWYHFAIMFEAVFILTTIDAGTRVARFILQEFAGQWAKPFKDTRWMPGVLITSFVVVFSWGFLLYNGEVRTIWPMFGIANQLLSLIALAIGTTLILKMAPKVEYALITFLPMCFMLIVTFSAGALSIRDNFWPLTGQAKAAAVAKALKTSPEAVIFQGYITTSLTVIILILATIVLADSAPRWIKWVEAKRKSQNEIVPEAEG